MANPTTVQNPTPVIITDSTGTHQAVVSTSPPITGVTPGVPVYANLGSEVVAVQQNTDGASSFDTVQVQLNASTATVILAANATRRSCLITNTSATINIYVGTSGVTASTGQLIAPGNSLSMPVTGAVYGIAASSTPTVTAIEAYS